MKKSGFITLALLIAMLASCGGSPADAETTVSDTTAGEAAETTSRFASDDLPELDFNGAEVNFLIGNYNNAYWGDYFAEETNGNRLNDTLYKMRNDVNERLNVNINFINYEYTWGERTEYFSAVTQTILAGSDDYDIQAGANFITEQMEGEYFYNLNDSKYINFDKAYWNTTINDVMPSDKVHFATGDGTLAAIKHTFCVFVNQDMLKSYNITDDLYQIVEDGKWTLDRLDGYAKQIYSDVNGNTEKDFDDTYGLTFGDMNKYLGFINGCGIDEAVKEKDGYKVAFGSERATDVLTKLCSMIYDSDYTFPALPNSENEQLMATGGGNFTTKVFLEGRSAFNCGLVQDASTIIPNIKFSCGILPYPKWDENEEHRSMLQRNAYFTIPVSCKDFDMSGAVLEAWSSLAHRELQPEYFEVSMKVRYSEDEGSARMFDIIRNTLSFDIGEIFASVLANPSAAFRDQYIRVNNTDWASYVASQTDTWQEKLNSIYESLQ